MRKLSREERDIIIADNTLQPKSLVTWNDGGFPVPKYERGMLTGNAFEEKGKIYLEVILTARLVLKDKDYIRPILMTKLWEIK